MKVKLIDCFVITVLIALCVIMVISAMNLLCALGVERMCS